MPQDAPGTYGTNALVAPSVEQVAVLGSTVPPSEDSQCLNDENNVMQVQNPLRINTSFASAADPFPTQAAGAEAAPHFAHDPCLTCNSPSHLLLSPLLSRQLLSLQL